MAADDVEFGHVVDLTLGEPSGTELVANAAIGATTLTVDYAGDFEDAGEVSLNGAVLPYTAIAYGAAETDPDVITLAAPLAAAAVVDDKVVRMSGGEQVADWLLHVSLGDGHPVDIPIPYEQRAMWSSVDPSTPIPVMVSADLERLVEVPGRTPVLDGSFIDPTSTIPGGQAFSLDAPTATDGYPEDYGWWQVDAAGKVLGFWRLVGGVWTAQTIVTAEALKANNAIITALTGETITGATVQTRAAQDRGVKLGEVKGATNYDEAFIVFKENGEYFIKAVPEEGMAVIAGEMKTSTQTTTDGSSLGGITEITRATDGTAGAVRLTGYTTAPKSAPTVTTGYDSVQFVDDGLWGNRYGWATDGTNWYTTRLAGAVQWIEKWSAAGTLTTTVGGGPANVIAGGIVYSGGDLYVFAQTATFGTVYRFSTALTIIGTGSTWLDDDGTSAAALGVDAGTGDLLVAQSRPSDVTVPNRVRIRRYTFNAGGNLTGGASVDTAFGYGNDLSGILYGTHDLGANRYIFTNQAGGQFRVVNTSGAAVDAEDWQAGTGGKVGFTYTGGAFVSMDTTGLMRTYTGQDKATLIGDAALTKWVSNDLSTATLHTDQSPRAKITIKKRTKLNVTTSAINTGGANAPDRVRIFVGQGAADPGRTAMWKQTDPAVGVISASYSSLATSGTNPVTPNGFIGAGGTVQRVEFADGTAFIDGVGNGTIPAGTFRNAVDARADTRVAAKVGGGTVTATIAGGAGVAVFTHGLGWTPASVSCTPETSTARQWRITAKTSTTFSVQFRDTAGAVLADAGSMTVDFVATA